MKNEINEMCKHKQNQVKNTTEGDQTFCECLAIMALPLFYVKHGIILNDDTYENMEH